VFAMLHESSDDSDHRKMPSFDLVLGQQEHLENTSDIQVQQLKVRDIPQEEYKRHHR
jgi:hypothetical protein